MGQHSRQKSLGNLFQLELDDEGYTVRGARELLLSLLAHTSHDGVKEQQQVAEDARHAYALALSPAGEVCLERFALLLAMRGHRVWLRTGRLDCCAGQVALRHTFVVAGAAGCTQDLMPQLFVVDPSFKEQFQLPNATPEYTALFQELPSLFVGTAEQLVPIVELMATQMQQAFADSATSCPPWRTPSCMLSKWLPSAADDVQVCPPGSGDSSSRLSTCSSATSHSGLSSPAQPFSASASASQSLLARIRTVAAAAAGDAAEGATIRLTPRSARSPLYFEEEQQLTSRRGLFGRVSSNEDLINTSVHAELLSSSGPQQTLLLQWGLPDGGRPGSDDVCYLASASWGLGGALASTTSSPGCDVPWSAMRNARSEDGSARASAGAATAGHGVAIVQRTPASKAGCGMKDSDGGFAQAFAFGRSAAGARQLMSGSPVVGVVGGSSAVSGSTMQQQQQQQQGLLRSVSSLGGYRGRLGGYRAAANASLDISRFDRSGLEDVAPAWDTWGSGSISSIGSSRVVGSGTSSSTSKPSVTAGPPVRRRVSSTSSQCSALSAAIAGKGVAPR